VAITSFFAVSISDQPACHRFPVPWPRGCSARLPRTSRDRLGGTGPNNPAPVHTPFARLAYPPQSWAGLGDSRALKSFGNSCRSTILATITTVEHRSFSSPVEIFKLGTRCLPCYSAPALRDTVRNESSATARGTIVSRVLHLTECLEFSAIILATIRS